MRAILLVCAARVAYAAVQNISVGYLDASGVSNLFQPPFLSDVAVGDTIRFVFNTTGQNYSVVQSMPDQACTPLPGGFNTGFIVGEGLSKSPSFLINITTSAPIYFYCAQPETDHGSRAHCLAGMSGAINVPAQTYRTYALAASALTALPSQSSSATTTSISTSRTLANHNAASTGFDDEPASGGLSVPIIIITVVASVIGASVLLCLGGWACVAFRARRTRRGEHRMYASSPPYIQADAEAAPPPRYSAITVVEEVGGQRIMRAATSGRASPSPRSVPTRELSMEEVPLTAPEDPFEDPAPPANPFDDARPPLSISTATRMETSDSALMLSARTDDPFADVSELLQQRLRQASPPPLTASTLRANTLDDAPPEYMSSRSVPPPFSPLSPRPVSP